jgi:flagellar P-ring protein precursor FlgI
MDTTKFDLAFQSLGNVVNAKTAINNYMGTDIAKVTSPNHVSVTIPEYLQDSYYDFLNTVLNIEIQPENFARVVMEERTGTVVMGADVRISEVAVSYGNMTITIASDAGMADPEAAPATDQAGVVMMPEAATVSDLVKALNSMGVTPGDMISIFQAIKAAGALHAELEII